MFVFWGGMAALIHMIARWCFSFYLPYVVAIVLGFGLGLVSAFFFFKFFVFRKKNSHKTPREIAAFLLVNALGITQTLVVSVGLAEYIFPLVGMQFYPHDIAHITGVLIPVFTSYLGHKYFTFKQ